MTSESRAPEAAAADGRWALGAFPCPDAGKAPRYANGPDEIEESAMRDGIQESLTRAARNAILLDVSQSENFAVRLHVDLRRQASAICAAGR